MAGVENPDPPVSPEEYVKKCARYRSTGQWGNARKWTDDIIG